MGLLDDAIREHLDLKRRRGADPAEVERAERDALGPVRRGPQGYAEPDDQPGDYDSRPAAAYDDAAHGFDQHDDDYEAPWEPAAADRAPAAAPLPHDGEHDAFDDYEYDDEFEEYEDDPVPGRPSALAPEPPLTPEPITAEEPLPPTAPPPQSLRFTSGQDHYDEHSSVPHAAPGHPDDVVRADGLIPGGLSDETAEFDVERAMAADDVAAAPLPPQAPPPAPAPPRRSPLAPPEEDDMLEETPEFLQDTPDHDRLWFEQKPPRDFDFDG